MTAIGTWADVFAASPAAVQAIGQELREIILAAHPGAVEVARPGDRAVSFGWGTRKMSEAYCYLMPQTDRVNLGFYRGSLLSDPAHLLEGTGKALRHIKVRDTQQARAPELAALVAAAVAERKPSGPGVGT